MPKFVRNIILPLVVLCGFSSCAKYQKQWDEAVLNADAPHSNITGAWTGSWKSTPSGHTGKLKCIIKESENGDYEFYYWATWARVISGGFRISCRVDKKNNNWTFAGEKNLGSLGGNFNHQGKGTIDKIEATYQSDRGDHGTFSLTRP